MLEEDAAVVGRELLELDVVERPLVLRVLLERLASSRRSRCRRRGARRASPSPDRRTRRRPRPSGRAPSRSRCPARACEAGCARGALAVNVRRTWPLPRPGALRPARPAGGPALTLACGRARRRRRRTPTPAMWRRLRSVVGPATSTSTSPPHLTSNCASGSEARELPHLGAARRRHEVNRPRGTLAANLAPGLARRPRCPPRRGARGSDRAAPPPRSAACRRARVPARTRRGRPRASARYPSAVATNSSRAPTGIFSTSTGA